MIDEGSCEATVSATIELFNPLAIVLTQARRAPIDPAASSAAAYFGVWQLAVPGALVGAAIVLGVRVFTREIPIIAERLRGQGVTL